MSLDHELSALKARVEDALQGLLTGGGPCEKLTESMRYSLLAGGKRLRPILTLKFCEAAGGVMDDAMPLALSLELIHTYSLIHDDLPCMDDDDLRRGKPTNHVVYGEARAVLAGDALQSAAFELALSAPLPPDRLVRAAGYLARAAGWAGMCGGQELDTAEGSDRSLQGLTLINDLKTGALIRAACVLGVIAAGGTADRLSAAEGYGLHLARAFQIRDDILDVISTESELGKPIGSDVKNAKPTYAGVLGVEGAGKLVLSETRAAVSALGPFEKNGFFTDLATYLSQRTY